MQVIKYCFEEGEVMGNILEICTMVIPITPDFIFYRIQALNGLRGQGTIMARESQAYLIH